MLFTLKSLCAQSLKDAGSLFAARKYIEAAEQYYALGYYGKAAESYRKHIDAQPGKRKAQESESIQPLIDRMERLERMVLRCEDIQIIDSIIVDKSDFLKNYLMSGEAGSLLPGGESVIYENELKDRRFFGEKRDGQASRLYQQIKIGSDWSEPQLLNIPVDSAGSDDFPFIMPDGLTMYFASTGNGSIGGYDIFTSRYNLHSDSYLAPTPLGMPFNSVYNDYLYIIDEFNGIGYFTTDRFQPEDKVIIYAFIPNESFKPLESTETGELVSRSRIESIRNTWKEGKDYHAILSKIRESISNKPPVIKKDFTFVINDNIIYHTLGDFESDAAKKSWQTAEDTYKQIQLLEKQLDIKRRDYSLGNKSQKQALESHIIPAETNLEKLYKQHSEKLKETRNLEIRHLRTKQ
ncbi:MAG: hypothetical protein LBS54_08715 [Dysgonamonadaceae bacterium]|jgi:hypothetical protein|nr:hypothetical protein [Dysgonamonadaceae bacterium]